MPFSSCGTRARSACKALHLSVHQANEAENELKDLGRSHVLTEPTVTLRERVISVHEGVHKAVKASAQDLTGKINLKRVPHQRHRSEVVHFMQENDFLLGEYKQESVDEFKHLAEVEHEHRPLNQARMTRLVANEGVPAAETAIANATVNHSAKHEGGQPSHQEVMSLANRFGPRHSVRNTLHDLDENVQRNGVHNVNAEKELPASTACCAGNIFKVLNVISGSLHQLADGNISLKDSHGVRILHQPRHSRCDGSEVCRPEHDFRRERIFHFRGLGFLSGSFLLGCLRGLFVFLGLSTVVGHEKSSEHREVHTVHCNAMDLCSEGSVAGSSLEPANYGVNQADETENELQNLRRSHVLAKPSISLRECVVRIHEGVDKAVQPPTEDLRVQASLEGMPNKRHGRKVVNLMEQDDLLLRQHEEEGINEFEHLAQVEYVHGPHSKPRLVRSLARKRIERIESAFLDTREHKCSEHERGEASKEAVVGLSHRRNPAGDGLPRGRILLHEVETDDIHDMNSNEKLKCSAVGYSTLPCEVANYVFHGVERESGLHQDLHGF
mmetsp:Transcript_7222/g.14056  ORF Transcript_7222/g.14056 Transcript_7222/m.14056 type:complete len:555 (+) Transcript_7222:1679-3343(+)